MARSKKHADPHIFWRNGRACAAPAGALAEDGSCPSRPHIAPALLAVTLLVGVPMHATAAIRAPVVERADSACYGGSAPGTRVHLALPNRYALELTRNPDSLAYEVACEVRVLDAAGRVVWSRTGFNAAVDPWTGHDVNGDGRPDLVVGVDVGGGNHDCCWVYTFFSLGARTRVLDTATFHPRFSQDSRGRTLLYEWVPFFDLGYSMADSPALAAVFRFRGDTLASVTAEYCAGLLGDAAPPPGAPQLAERPSPAALAASRQLPADTGEVPYKVERTRVAIMSLALQELECGYHDRAERLIQATWPSDEADAQWTQVEGAWRKRKGK